MVRGFGILLGSCQSHWHSRASCGLRLPPSLELPKGLNCDSPCFSSRAAWTRTRVPDGRHESGALVRMVVFLRGALEC